VAQKKRKGSEGEREATDHQLNSNHENGSGFIFTVKSDLKLTLLCSKHEGNE